MVGFTRRNLLAPKLFLTGMAGSLVAALLIIAAMVLLGEYTKNRGRLLLTALIWGSFCLSALAPSLLYQRHRYRFLAVSGILVSLAGFVVVSTGIWAAPDANAFWKAAAIVSVLAAASFLVSLMLLPEPVRWLLRLLTWAVVAAASLGVLLATLGIIFEVKIPAYWWAEFLSVVSALAGSMVVKGLTLSGRGKVDPPLSRC